jgi:hypothetical protein
MSGVSHFPPGMNIDSARLQEVWDALMDVFKTNSGNQGKPDVVSMETPLHGQKALSLLKVKGTG